MYENLQLNPEGLYCSDNQYIQIRQITRWMQYNTNIRGNWYYTGENYIAKYDICLAERITNGTTVSIRYTSIPYNEIPQKVLDYLNNNGYKYRP